MKHAQVVYSGDFTIITGNARSQAAVMVIPAGESEGSSKNRHKGSDQWLYVASGEGSATISDQVHILRPGTLLLIEHGETHEIRNEGHEPLRTLNFYVPPGYNDAGEELPAGKS